MMVNIPIEAYLRIGCKLGQKVVQQIHCQGKECWVYVYDKKTERLIGKIPLEEV